MILTFFLFIFKLLIDKQKFFSEQVPCYSADYVVDSAATSYMELPPARNVVVQNNVSQINQTTATQCEPDSMREDSDKVIFIFKS